MFADFNDLPLKRAKPIHRAELIKLSSEMCPSLWNRWTQTKLKELVYEKFQQGFSLILQQKRLFTKKT